MVPRGPAVLEQDPGPIFHLRGQCFSLNPERHESCAHGPARWIFLLRGQSSSSKLSKGNIAMGDDAPRLGRERLWISTQLVKPTDPPTASNIDCLSPPAEQLQLDAVRVYSLYSQKVCREPRCCATLGVVGKESYEQQCELVRFLPSCHRLVEARDWRLSMLCFSYSSACPGATRASEWASR